MSDGFVTVSQCVEGLPLGRCVWEALLCAFLAWFSLGAINESSPLAFSLISTEWAPTDQRVASMAAALASGNFLSIIASGWIADKYGRLAVIRPSLLLTVASGLLLQAARTFLQAVVARFVLGFVSGGLLSVVPPLIAEILPSKHRGFYLTVWCCGWPAGALFAMTISCSLPDLNWRAFYTLMLIPSVFLFVGTKLDMLMESPRYLYFAGRRDEGFNTLIDMYDKEELPLPWASDTIAVTCAPASRPALRFGSSYPVVSLLLAVAMLCASSAAHSMKLWMPTMLIAHEADADVAGMHEVVDMMSFAAGPRAVSLLSTVRAPLMTAHPSPVVIQVLAQAYAVEFVGIIACAYLSMCASRKAMVQGALLCAPLMAVASLAAAGHGYTRFCGPIIGLMLAAQSTGLNFLQAFTAEHFPTSSRARTAAFVNFAAQFGNFTIPMIGGIIVQRASPGAAVLSFAGLSVFGWVVSTRLPLPTGSEEPLHDVDEARPPRSGSRQARKLEWASYNAI